MAKFSVRARAVDMLGRQQIAGIPTAIHELFKNAHDAYATRVEVDYIRAQKVLIVRDDGLGMTKADFEGKWLALGTDSKVGKASKVDLWTGPRNLPIRPLLGEKGIGRLAIATISPVALVLSRAVTPDGLQEIACCLVCWPLFELPGIDIGDVVVPLRTFDTFPGRSEVSEMVKEITANISQLVQDQDLRDELSQLVESANVDPMQYDEWLGEIARETDESNLSLQNAEGTHFYLFNTDPLLEVDISEDIQGRAPSMKRVLLGFGNTMDPNYPAPVKAEFRDHKVMGSYDELIGKDEFFSAADLEKADHYFEGEFDEYGQFLGKIRIFQGDKQDYVLSWPEALGRPTKCGPFKLRLAVIQGTASESLLHPEAWSWFDKRARRYGGLYIYRDGIRVLPYGLPDFDWLGIEHRRTMSASDWFFSHRRMAGYIALTSGNNNSLSEKAGREGFRENEAYRTMRSILENWFTQVAKDFFRRSSDRGEEYRETVEEKRREAELIRRRKAKVGELRTEFKDRLESRLELIEGKDPQVDVQAVLDEMNERLHSLKNAPNPQKVEGSIDAEENAVQRLNNIAEQLSLVRPRAFSLGKRETSSFETYSRWVADFENSVLEPAQEKARCIADDWRSEWGAEVSRSRQAREGVGRDIERVRRDVRDLRARSRKSVAAMGQAAEERLTYVYSEFLNQIENLSSELERIDFDELSPESSRRRQREIESAIAEDFSRARNQFVSLQNQLDSVGAEIRQGIFPEDTLAALESRTQALEAQLDLYSDLAQAGSAVGIVGHEMENVILGLRASIRDIGPWADGTPELGEVYGRLRTYFDHLDSYVGLFAPLSRRVRRKRVEVTGNSIHAYLSDLFGGRLDSAGIELRTSQEFRDFSIYTFRSTIVAAAVNIVDNAIYWIESDRHAEKWISLGAMEQGITIENGGPGVPMRLSEEIFEFGTSSKPGGRGMGLAISREALSSVGLQLSLVSCGVDEFPKFFIGPQEIENSEDD